MENYCNEDVKFVFLPEETECAYCVDNVCAPGTNGK